MKKKLKHILSVIFVAVILLSVVPFTVSGATEDLTFSVSQVIAKPGEKVEVEISMKNNPGIASIGLNVNYNSEILSVENIVFNSQMGGSTQSSQYSKNPARLIWINPMQNYNGDTWIAKISFRVNENAPAGSESELSITYDEDDIYNIAENNIDCVVKNGSVKVKGENKPKLIGNSLNLQGKIGVNFYYDLAGSSAENAVVKFHWGNHSQMFNMNNAVRRNKAYEVSCYVAAKEMADQITAELYVDNQLCSTDTYSVKEYAEYIINANIMVLRTLDPSHDSIALKELCKAMLYYGAKSQVMFDYNVENLSTKGVKALDGYSPSDSSAIVVEQYNRDFSDFGIEYCGSSMSLKSDTTYTLFFKLKDMNKFSNTVVRYGDTTLSFVNKGKNVYYLEFNGILARDITEDIVLTFNDKERIFNTKSYMTQALDNDDPALAQTVKALYNYNQRAIEYFG